MLGFGSQWWWLCDGCYAWQVVPNKNKVFPTLDPHLVGRGIVNIVEKGLAKKVFLALVNPLMK
jgi:hypothetical protein